MRFLLGGDVRLQSRELSLSLSLGDLEPRLELLELLGATLIARISARALAARAGRARRARSRTVCDQVFTKRVNSFVGGDPRRARGKKAAVHL